MPNANLYAKFEPTMAGAADRVAFQSDGDGSVSYAEVGEAVNRTANALISKSIAPGDRVMAQVEKSLANIYLYLATLKIGAVFNPLNTAYTPAELDYFIGDAEPAMVVVPAGRFNDLQATIKRHGVKNLESMEADGSGSLSDCAAACAQECTTAVRAPGDLAALLYTSGTTGRSKGAMITHQNLVSNAETLHKLWRFAPGDVVLHALPTFHVHGLFVALHTGLLNASKMLWLPRFDVDAVLALLPHATVMMGVPTFYTRLLADDRFGRKHTADMRLFVAGSAPLLAETHAAFEARTGHRILERYGMTEAGMITSNPYDPTGRIAGSVGYPLPGIDVRVAGGQGGQAPSGEVGTLEVKGPNVFKGYWRMPGETAQEFRGDGYFITGDLAKMAADGRLEIVGRAKDLIISGGLNIYPKEIEEQIDLNPAVKESAVIGVTHPDLGEGVIAVVTPRDIAVEISSTDILEPLEAHLAKFKLPKRIFVLDELPRNTMGKVQKAELRACYADVFSEAE